MMDGSFENRSDVLPLMTPALKKSPTAFFIVNRTNKLVIVLYVKLTNMINALMIIINKKTFSKKGQNLMTDGWFKYCHLH